jgi:hypothetical protein
MNPTFRRQLLITFIPAVAILIAIAAANVFFQVSILRLTRDVAHIAQIHPLSGFLSNVGALLWCATASICAFAAMTVRRTELKDKFWFLFYSALLSAYLLFDDFFVFHDVLAPLHLGLHEIVVYAAIAFAVLIYLMKFWRTILGTNYGFFVLALGFLSASVMIDVFVDPGRSGLRQWQFFLEDGAKFLGIASWFSYYVRTSYEFLIRACSLPKTPI